MACDMEGIFDEFKILSSNDYAWGFKYRKGKQNSSCYTDIVLLSLNNLIRLMKKHTLPQIILGWWG